MVYWCGFLKQRNNYFSLTVLKMGVASSLNEEAGADAKLYINQSLPGLN